MDDDAKHPPRRTPPSSFGSWQESFREVAPYLGLGSQMVLTMVLFVAGGYFLDQRFGTTPWLLLAAALLGMVAVFTHLTRVVRRLNENARARRQADPSDEHPPDAS